MRQQEFESSAMQNARHQLESIKGKTLTLEQRETEAVHLAMNMLEEANRIMTHEEKKVQEELARMMDDPQGKAFTTSMTDQCFRSSVSSRIANQLVYLLGQLGIPQYLSLTKRAQLSIFQHAGTPFSFLFVPMATYMLRRATAKVILPGEPEALSKHMQLRREQGVRLNINHLGEAILGEEEAKRRLHIYIEDLKREDFEYVSVKISTIYSQIHLLGWEKTLAILSERLRQLYRVAMSHQFRRSDGKVAQKFVNLDMEEYRDLILTKELFKTVLNEKEFHQFSAGIVLQAYLPDAHEIQKELTEWAMDRIKKGGAPIKIRVVKGANLAMEQFEASLRDWNQTPYTKKSEVDANYKRMVTYGCLPPHAKAVHLGIASHNLFDIAYAMLLRSENGVEEEISFEMLEGMADHMRRVVQRLAKDILLYCPVATKGDFQSAIAYLIRRLDENTGPDNFLRHTFGLKTGSRQWEEQVLLFSHACREMNTVYMKPRREQNRLNPPDPFPLTAPFKNEADTDFSLMNNRIWANGIAERWKALCFQPIPAVIGGKEIHQSDPQGLGFDPSYLKKCLYRYSLCEWKEVDEAIQCAKSHEGMWASKTVDQRCELLSCVADHMRKKRGELIGVMMCDGGKTILESDPEVSEAIDFAEYYLRSMKKMGSCPDIDWKPKGTVLVTPPWNFPISIPTGGILAALVAGNCVIFKPAPEAVLSGWILANILWDAGIPKEVFQFINCADNPVGSRLISDPRINMIVLTGATETARLFMRLRPGVDLAAETGGKNAMIVTSLADRDLAIKEIVQSAFGHNGQKCSACSLAILEAEVYDDPHFRKQLKDAVESLRVGSCWDLGNKVTPLIREPSEALRRGLTVLEAGEEWLVTPHQDPHHLNLWTPGVKYGVKQNSFMHQTELFGPVLGVMRAKNLKHAIEMANGTPYGLTSGLQSLDDREIAFWMEHIESGNCYINRGITGAIVRRQPFGGTKSSSFGQGLKAGGPNYISQFAIPTQTSLPQDKHAVIDAVNQLSSILQRIELSAEELGIWFASVSSYAFWAVRFAQDHDPSQIIGQDNLLRYRPYQRVCFRIQEHDRALDIMRILAAGLSCGARLEVSLPKEDVKTISYGKLQTLHPLFHFIKESDDQLNTRVKEGKIKRLRLARPPSEELKSASIESGCYIAQAPVLANGRFELLHYLREIAFSIDYHRYGNLGIREGEMRKRLT